MTAVEVQPLGPVGATRLLLQRNYIVYRKAWKLFITGFLEPFFYLLSIGIGVGQLIDTFEFNGRQVPVRRVRRARHARGLGAQRRAASTRPTTPTSSSAS